MPPWYLKAAAQGTMSRLPSPQRWNRLFQRHVTRRLRLTDDYVQLKASAGLRHLELLVATRAAGAPPEAVLELGTGWFPIVPVTMALAGVARVVTVDAQPLLRRAEVTATLATIRRLTAAGSLVLPPTARDRLDRALDGGPDVPVATRLGQLGVEVVVGDARRLDLPAGSFDGFISHETLEHIDRPTLRELFAELARTSRPGAAMSHFIDMADHYWDFDPTLDPYHFLRFDEDQWRWFNNSLQFQNRVRLCEFRRLHAETGWAVVGEHDAERDVAALRRAPIAAAFAGFDKRDLAVYRVWMTSRLVTPTP